MKLGRLVVTWVAVGVVVAAWYFAQVDTVYVP